MDPHPSGSSHGQSLPFPLFYAPGNRALAPNGNSLLSSYHVLGCELGYLSEQNKVPVLMKPHVSGMQRGSPGGETQRHLFNKQALGIHCVPGFRLGLGGTITKHTWYLARRSHHPGQHCGHPSRGNVFYQDPGWRWLHWPWSAAHYSLFHPFTLFPTTSSTERLRIHRELFIHTATRSQTSE